MTGKELLKAEDVAEMTGVALQTLANWRSLGKGPAWFKLGWLVRYDESAVEEWLDRMRAGDPA